MAELSAGGEDVLGRIRCPQYLLLARTLLLGSSGSPGRSSGLGSGLPWKWWALRTVAVQQRILSGPAAALQTEIQQLTEEVGEFGTITCKLLGHSGPISFKLLCP